MAWPRRSIWMTLFRSAASSQVEWVCRSSWGLNLPVSCEALQRNLNLPGAVSQVCCLVFPVALADRDTRPGFGGDVDGAPDPVTDGVQPFGGGSDVAVGVVGAARVATRGAEDQVVGRRRV